MIVRRELPGDVPAVRDVVAAAFQRGAPGATPVEVGLLDALRADAGWLPRYSLVALHPVSSEVIGHVVCTRGDLAGGPAPMPALGLGPIAVHPDHQHHGVGTALMHAVLGAAEANDEHLVALLGEPAFYARFGFMAASSVGVAPPDPAWGGYFQVRHLTGDHRGSGVFRYAAPFRAL